MYSFLNSNPHTLSARWMDPRQGPADRDSGDLRTLAEEANQNRPKSSKSVLGFQKSRKISCFFEKKSRFRWGME